ncbi:MAG: hypothetical protein WCS52_15575 [bacterium]
MNTQMRVEFVRGLRMRRVVPVLVLAGFLAAFAGSAQAATATWTNTANNSSGYWTNGLLWNQSVGNYPGSGAAGETAYLTSNIANTYTCILDSTLTYPLNALSLSNANAAGQAWLILTNATLGASTVTLNNGGRLQIDNNGVLTNVNTLTWTGTNGVVYLNNGGKLFSTNDVSISTASMQALVTGTGGIWDLGGKNSYVGLTVSTASLLMAGVTLTNVNQFAVGYNGVAQINNNAVLTTGARLFSKSGVVSSQNANGNAGTSNTITVTDNSLWNLGSGSLTIGYAWSGSGSTLASNSLVWVDAGGVITNMGAINISGNSGTPGVGGWGTVTGSRLVVASGGKLFGTGSSVTVNGYSAGNGMVIDGGGVTGGAVATNLGAVAIGNNGSAGSYLSVTNGGQLFSGGGDAVIGGSLNQCLVVGSPTALSRWDLGGSNLFFGFFGSSNSLRIDGGIVTNVNQFTVGYSGLPVVNNTAVFTNGAKVFSKSGYVGLMLANANSGTSNSVTMTANSLWDLGAGSLTIGKASSGAGSASVRSSLVWVDTGSVLTNVGAISIGHGAGGQSGVAESNRLVIASGGKLFGTGSNLVIGASTGNGMVIDGGMAVNLGAISTAANAVDSYLTVINGGLVEATSLTFGGTVNNNVISNSGGIYQFTTNTPVISAASGSSSVAINGGTIAFRNVTGVNVKTNWSGTSLARMLFTGTNAFRLNAATNATTGQDYTFAAGLGATNYARLELLNGSLYRGGNVTIGTNGTLLVSNGVSTINGALSFVSNSTLSVDVSSSSGFGYLVATNVNLNGCTLNLNLGSPPVLDTPFMIISNTSAGTISGQFSSGSRYMATINNTNYIVSISTASGNGVVVSTRLRTLGTSLIIQ